MNNFLISTFLNDMTSFVLLTNKKPHELDHEINIYDSLHFIQSMYIFTV